MSSTDMPELVAKRLGYALKRAQHALRVSMDEALRPLELTTPQYAVLSAVEAEAGLSNARLARAAFVTAQAMQGVLANLERDALLQRRPDPNHGRVLRSELTARGRHVLAKAHLAVRVVEDRMVASFGQADAARLASSLSKCADDLNVKDTTP
ncbi:MAG: MarR family transcriptional regulator [Acidobacteriales bacterium]|nr:MarR family transcriptional regulator [Terriglobales bacterium]